MKEIKFPDKSSVPAIRLEAEIEIADAVENLGLSPNRPTIVLVGGAGGLAAEDQKKLAFLFSDILAPLAEMIKANVIDGGTDAGIMRLMGQARANKSASFPLIGVAAEGTVFLPGITSANPDAAPLESNHSHFILVPGANWGDESPWLSRVASVLAKTAPAITVLINGGEIARKDVTHSLASERPVIIIAGSGRLADELAFDYKQDTPLIKVINLSDNPQNLFELLKNLLRSHSMNKFDEYKLFVEDTARFSDRRQTVTNIYVAVNSVILTGVAFLVKDAGLVPVGRAFVVILILIAGIIICSQWKRLINKYKCLVNMRITQLRLMEDHPDMAHSHKMYHAEDELYPRDSEGNPVPGQGLNISDLEKWLPLVFIIVYGIFIGGLFFSLIFNWSLK